MMPLDTMLTSAFGIMLGALAHAVGWPMRPADRNPSQPPLPIILTRWVSKS